MIFLNKVSTLTFVHREVMKLLTRFPMERARILIAVSGGKDSLCLMRVMKDILNLKSCAVGVVHCDHRWRDDSSENAKRVYCISKKYGFSFYLGLNRASLLKEALARKWRYLLLFNVATYFRYDIILTAHSETDQLETFFLNICRGTSFYGANSLFCARAITAELLLIRPLLTVSQSETYWFCRNFYLPIWSDLTNFRLHQKRSRLRHELFPYFRQYINPSFDQKIGLFLHNLDINTEYLNKYSVKLYVYVVHPVNIAIHVERLMKLSALFQIKILRTFLQCMAPEVYTEHNLRQISLYIYQEEFYSKGLQLDNYLLIYQKSYLYFCCLRKK